MSHTGIAPKSRKTPPASLLRLLDHRDELPLDDVADDHDLLDRVHDCHGQAVGEREGAAASGFNEIEVGGVHARQSTRARRQLREIYTPLVAGQFVARQRSMASRMVQNSVSVPRRRSLTTLLNMAPESTTVTSMPPPQHDHAGRVLDVLANARDPLRRRAGWPCQVVRAGWRRRTPLSCARAGCLERPRGAVILLSLAAAGAAAATARS